MGQKVNPISNRLGIIRGWDSNWYGGKYYGDKLMEDSKIRIYLNARLAKAMISRIIIERTLKLITITVYTAKPGLIIGKLGQDVDKLKEELKKITDKDVQINIFEVRRPEVDALIVANSIARQLEGRIPYRRAIKTAIASTIKMGAEGIKVLISGRLNGAEMARSEMYKEGRTPLHTFRADIDYARAEALTKTGLLGLKVWICRGEIYGRPDLSPNFGQKENNLASGTPRKGGSGGDYRREGGGFQRNEGKGFQRKEGEGFQRKEGGYQRREGEGHQRREGGGHQHKEGGYQRKEGGGFPRKDNKGGGFPRKDNKGGGFKKDNNNKRPNR